MAKSISNSKGNTMRTKLALLWLLSYFSVCPAYAAQGSAAPTPASKTPAPATTPAAAAPIAAPTTATEATIATLADVSRPKPVAAATAPGAAPRAGAVQTETPINVIDPNGRVVDASAIRLGSAPKVKKRVKREIELVRMSDKGAQRTAMLSINGVARFVTPGDTVLKKTVGEIRRDGVCLYEAPSKSKCSQFLTFELFSNE